jgi:hypothetical protein
VPELGSLDYEVSAGSLQEDLAWAHVVGYVSSAVSLEAMGQGVPAVYLDVGKCVDPDPLIGAEELRWAAWEPGDLRRALQRIEALSDEAFEAWRRRAAEYVEQYFLPATPQRLQAFVDALSAGGTVAAPHDASGAGVMTAHESASAYTPCYERCASEGEA